MCGILWYTNETWNLVVELSIQFISMAIVSHQLMSPKMVELMNIQQYN